MKRNVMVSIIVVTYNSSNCIKKCIDSLISSSFADFEIIVFDNNSKDLTNDIVAQYRDNRIHHFTSSENFGYAEGNNRAVKHSSGEVLFFLNPDTFIYKHTIANLMKFYKENNRRIFQPLILLPNKRINASGILPHFLGFNSLRDYEKNSPSKNNFIFSCSGSAFLITRSLFLKLRGFDSEYFMYFEDSDLCWRAVLSGETIEVVPNAIVTHDYEPIPKTNYFNLSKKYFYYERNRILTIFKNYSLSTLILLMPILITLEIGMIFSSIVQGWFASKLKSYISIIRHLPHLLKGRKISQENRRLKDAEVLRDFHGPITHPQLRNAIIEHIANPIFEKYLLFLIYVSKIL